MKKYLLALSALLIAGSASASERYLHYTCTAYSTSTKQILLNQFHLNQTTDKSVFQLRYAVLAAGADPKAQESLRDYQFRAKPVSASSKLLNAKISKDGTVSRWINYDMSTHETKKLSTVSEGYIQLKKVNKSLDGEAILPAFNNNQKVLVKCSVENISSEGGETCSWFFCL